jgi:hypothetical protein
MSMANPDKKALQAQIQSDPRVQAYIAHTGRPFLKVPASVLQSFGYAVPNDWAYYWSSPNSGGKGWTSTARGGQLVDEHDAWDVGTMAAGGGLLGLGVAGALGAGPLAGASGSVAAGGAEAAADMPSFLAGAPALGADVPGIVAGAGLPAATSTVAGAGAAGLLGKLGVPAGLEKVIGAGAGIIPLLMQGRHDQNTSGFDQAGITDQIGKTLATQNARMTQAQPAFDTLVRMAYGMSPTRYRTAATGGAPSQGEQNAFRYMAPRFGGST